MVASGALVPDDSLRMVGKENANLMVLVRLLLWKRRQLHLCNRNEVFAYHSNHKITQDSGISC